MVGIMVFLRNSELIIGMERFSRNIGAITQKEQAKLAQATVGVVGLGGTGSSAFEVLVRLGIGNFVIFDKDKFEESNLNRQIYANQWTLGKWKVDVAVKRAQAINPSVRIQRYAEELGKNNVSKLAKCDVVVDGVDNLKTRKIIAEFCGKQNIPYVFCAAGGSRGMISVFKGTNFSKVFAYAQEPRHKHVLAPAAMMAGVLAASQALLVLLGKKSVEAPEFIFFDIFSKRLFWKEKL